MRKIYKKSIRWLFVLLAAFVMAGGASAQNLGKIPQVTAISPDAASLFKTLERPLGTATGTIPISFPLLSLSSGSLSASLSLDYNSTGGIRVEEVASSVGLGFSLADGAGRITQQIHGLPDDLSAGMINNTNKPSGFNPNNMEHLWEATQPYFWDLEPDVFFYNFNGKSGKFVIKENGTVLLSDNNGIKVEYLFASPIQNGIRKWIITDDKGNKYYFGQNKSETINYKLDNEYEIQSLVSPLNIKTGYSSRTWYLTEVKDMNEENTLKYSYVTSSGTLYNLAGGFNHLLNLSGGAGLFNIAPEWARVRTETYEYLVSKIEGKSGYILVNSGTGRSDGWGRKINTIEAYDSVNVLKKKYKFSYGYFAWTESRLKLNSFSECATTGTDSIPYKFEYNASPLPARLSNSVDYWGFYNDNYSSSTIPNLYTNYSGYNYRKTDGATRSGNGTYAQACILTKITYPTGGYREYIYEGNTALQSTSYQHLYDPSFTANQNFSRSDFNSFFGMTPCMKQNFVINSTNGGALFDYLLEGAMCSYTVKLFKVTTPGDQFGGTLRYTINNQPTQKWNLENGEFRIEVFKPSSGCTFDFLEGNWQESTLSTATITLPDGYVYHKNNTNVGGVRIKEIRDYDPVSAKTNKTEYKYKLYSQDSTLTSGRLITALKLVTLENPGSIGGQYLAATTSSSYPLATSGGSYVMYSEVRTIESGNGRTDRKYSFFPDEYMTDPYPVVPAEDMSFARGNLEWEKVYNQAGTLLRKKSYGYWYGDHGAQVGIRFKPYYYYSTGHKESPSSGSERPVDRDYSEYYYAPRSVLPYETIDSVFSAAGVYVTKTNSYYTQYNNHLFLTKIKTKASNDQTKITTFRYPFTSNGDFTFGLTSPEQTIKLALQTANYFQPIEIVDSIKPAASAAVLLSGSKFILTNPSGSKYYLSQVKNYISGSDFTETYLSAYDTFGNLTEKQLKGSAKEVYLWGYKNSYPVAKITESNITTVAGLIVNSTIQNLSTTDANMRTELNKIRTGLASTPAQVVTYTYSPLLGMTSSTDAKGMTTYYEYDAFGRLKLLKDKDGNIVKTYSYNYKP
jgi:YD repeat-containing protein